MSQIRKLQPGGSTATPKKKLGSLTIGGRRYEATDDFIEHLSDYLSYGNGTAPLAGLTAALQNGLDIDYDSVGNHIRGMSGNWTGISDKDNEKRTAGKDYEFNNALRYLAGFYYQPPKKDSNASEISGDRVFFEYDDSGNLLKSSGNYLTIQDRLNRMRDYFADENAGKYKLSNKYTNTDITGMRGLYSQNKDAWDTKINKILGRAEKGIGTEGGLTSEDLAFLKNFRIMDGSDEDTTGGSTGSAKRLTQKQINDLVGKGYSKDLLDKYNGKIIVNADGSLSIEGNDWGLGDYNSGNYYFNDDFYTYAKDASKYSPFKGLTLFENQLYSNTSKGLSDILNREDGYNAAIQRGDFVGAQNYIKTNWRPGELFNPGVVDSDSYLPDFTSPSIRINNVTGLKTVNGMLPGQQLVQTIDLAAPDAIQGNPYRQYTYKYSLLDEYGKKIRDVADDEVTDVIGGQSAGDIRAYKLLSGINPRSKYANRYYYDYVAAGDENGEKSPLRAYISKSDPNDIIMQMDGLDDNVIIPKEIAQLLFSNPNFVNKLSNLDAQGMADLKEFLRSLQDPSKRFFHNYLFDTEWWSDSNWNNVAKSLGLSNDEMLQLKQLVEKEKNQTNHYSISRPVIRSQKNGGIIKNQKGGVAGGSTQTRGVSERIVDTQKFYNPKNAAGITDAKIFGGDGKNWTDADTADLVALGADLGSLGLAFAPGANIASAVVGAAGTLTRFKADKDRGDKNAGWNLALNLGMDAATLLPLLGGVAKGAKTAKAIKAVAPTLIKAASVFGLGTTFVNSVSKIASGEKWTVRDVSNVVNGLTAATALSKTGGLGKNAKKTKEFSEISIKGKKGNGVDLTGHEITIKKSDLGADFDTLPAVDQQKRIADAALSQMRTKTGNSSLTPEQLANAIEGGVPTSISGTELVIRGKRAANAGLSDGDITLSKDEIKAISENKVNQKEALEKLVADKVRVKTGNSSLTDAEALSNVDLNQFSKQGKIKLSPGKGWMRRKSPEFDFNPKTTSTTSERSTTGNWLYDWWYGIGARQKSFNANWEKGTNPYLEGRYTVSQRAKITGYQPKTVKLGNQKLEFSGDEVAAIHKDNSKLYDILKQKLGRDANPKTIAAWSNKFNKQRNVPIWEKQTTTDGTMPIWVNMFSQKGWLTQLGVTPYRRTTNILPDTRFRPNGMRDMNQVITYDARQGFSMPHIFSGYVGSDANWQNNEYQTPAGFTPLYVYEKGGKVLKGEQGLPGQNFLKELEDEENNINKYEEKLYAQNPELAPGNDINRFNFYGTHNFLAEGIGGWKPGNSSNGSSVNGEQQGAPLKRKTIFNPNTAPVISGINAAIAVNDVKRQQKRFNDFLNNYKYGHAYFENTPRFISSGEGDRIREAADRYLSLPNFKTSDSLRNYAIEKDKFSNRNRLLLEGDLADSRERSKYFANVDEVARTNSKAAYNFDMSKLNQQNQIAQSKATTDIGAMSQISKIRDQFMNNVLARNAEDAYYARANQFARQYSKDDIDNITKWTEALSKIEDQNSPDAKRLQGLIDAANSRIQGNIQTFSSPNWWHTAYVKKGGKISDKSKVEYSRDPYPELLIENTKAAHRYAEMLSKETLRMLAKIKPLHVS